MTKDRLSDNIKPFLDYLGLKDDIDYDEKITGGDLEKYTSLKLSNSNEYIKYKNNNHGTYEGILGETRSHIELIIPKQKLKTDYLLYREDQQYYILYVTAYIKKVYKCEFCAYTVDFKKWYTNPGLIEV